MTRHLISATLTPEAYEWYQQWVKDRKASEKISESIVAFGFQMHHADQIIEWKKRRLPHLIHSVITKLSKEDWFKIRPEDRYALWDLVKGTGQWGIPEMTWDFRMPHEPHPTQEFMGEEE